MRLKSQDIRDRLKDIETFLLREYKENKEIQKRDWRTYEQRLLKRLKGAFRNLDPLIEEATNIKVHRAGGRPPKLATKQKVIILLLKRLMDRSNRMMSSMLTLFSLLSGIETSYKSVERLYSDPEVEMTIHNLHQLILKQKGIKTVNACGDGTGYSLMIKKHYASETEKRKQRAKKANKKEKPFVYSFQMLDLESKMYLAYGVSFKSEKQAFERALKMLREIDVEMESVRLDRYYSFPSYVDRFGKTKVYLIPRKNATLRGSKKWKETMKRFIRETLAYLKEYYLRNNSESGISADKRWFGWKVGQKREDRINTAITCTNLWHNILNLYTQ